MKALSIGRGQDGGSEVTLRVHRLTNSSLCLGTARMSVRFGSDVGFGDHRWPADVFGGKEVANHSFAAKSVSEFGKSDENSVEKRPKVENQVFILRPTKQKRRQDRRGRGERPKTTTQTTLRSLRHPIGAQSRRTVRRRQDDTRVVACRQAVVGVVRVVVVFGRRRDGKRIQFQSFDRFFRRL